MRIEPREDFGSHINIIKFIVIESYITLPVSQAERRLAFELDTELLTYHPKHDLDLDV